MRCSATPLAALPACSSRNPARRAPDGFVIVAVLWILGAMATLASIYAVYVIDTATAFRAHDDQVEAEGLVSAALELTALQVSAQRAAAQQAPPPDATPPQATVPPGAGQQGTARPQVTQPSSGGFSFRMRSASVTAQFRSEAARIDLNGAPKELLAGLFLGLGARPDDALAYAERIVGWRTKPPPGQDLEASLYQTAGRRYAPRGGPFQHPGELWLVHGLSEALVERAMPLVTVYNGVAQVNVLDAPPDVIAALPGMTPDRLHAFLAQRQVTPQNGQILLALLGQSASHATVEPTKTMRVTVRVSFDNGRQISSEVVIFVSENDTEPYRVLSWRDGLEG
ncbi:MAG: general secretion pathway protein GspK [Xanthobacteraceae bacterium]